MLVRYQIANNKLRRNKMKNFTALPISLLIEGLPRIEDISTKEKYNPDTVVVAYVSGQNTVGNYKYSWKHRMDMANLLSIGGTALVVLPFSNSRPILVRETNPEIKEMWRTHQTIYMFQKYDHITEQTYLDHAKLVFSGMTKGQIRAFIRRGWEPLMKDRYATEILDADYRDALASFEDERLENIRLWQAKQQLAMIWTEAAQKGIRLYEKDLELIKDLPNQEVTARQMPESDTVKRRVWDNIRKVYTNEVYWKRVTKYASDYPTKVEAAIVNAWHYGTPGFRVPSLDEQVKELKELREWFTEYKYHAKRNNVRKPHAKTVEKFDRLEYLEVEVGAYLEGDQRIATLGNTSRRVDHTSRKFKEGRLAQLMNIKNELNQALEEELAELIEELRK